MATSMFTPIFLGLALFASLHAKPPPGKVNIDVYYESLCPDSRAFFNDQMWPTFQKLEARMNLTLIPYGNARVVGGYGDWSFTCQHGPDECYGNIVQTCAIHLMNDTRSSLKFVLCAFKYRSQANIINECERSTLMQQKLHQCSTGPLGKNLEFQMATKTETLSPPQTFIPWITVNGKGSQDINRQANYDLMRLVCSSFQHEIPSVCGEQWRLRRDI